LNLTSDRPQEADHPSGDRGCGGVLAQSQTLAFQALSPEQPAKLQKIRFPPSPL
jgi:hypothetical protein